MEANLNSAEQENLRFTATFFKTFPKALACFTHAGNIIITGWGVAEVLQCGLRLTLSLPTLLKDTQTEGQG